MPAPARVLAPERLDAPAHDPAVLRASLAQVAAVNRWLGGRRALRLALAPYRRPGLRVLDVGTGSADLPIALARDARVAGGAIGLVATDRHAQILAIAAGQLVGWPKVPNRWGLGERGFDTAAAQGIQLAGAEATALPFATDSFDVVVLSLVLHHLDDGAARLALCEAARVAPLVIVNEPHRTRATTWARACRADPLARQPADQPRRAAVGAASLSARGTAVACGRGGTRRRGLRRRWFQRLVLVAERPALPLAGPVPA
jgi:SAM-dependent methyltransferase